MMQTPTRAQITSLLESLTNFRKILLKQDAIAIQLFRHPDVTANQVMATQISLAKTCADYRAAHKRTGDLFGKTVPWRDAQYERWQQLKY